MRIAIQTSGVSRVNKHASRQRPRIRVSELSESDVDDDFEDDDFETDDEFELDDEDDLEVDAGIE